MRLAVVAHLDQDRRQDVLLLTGVSSMPVNYQLARGTLDKFVAIATDPLPLGLAIGDVTDDGVDDVVVGHLSNVVQIFERSKHPYTKGLLDSIPKKGTSKKSSK